MLVNLIKGLPLEGFGIRGSIQFYGALGGNG